METEVRPAEGSGAPEYMDVDASVHLSTNLGNMDETIEYSTMPCQNNSESVEYEVLP